MNELYKKRINFLVTNSQTKKKYMDITRKMKKKCRKKVNQKTYHTIKQKVKNKKLKVKNKNLKVKKKSEFKC